MPDKLVFDETHGIFRVYLQQDSYATVKVEVKSDVYVITSTKVPEELQGRGYGKLMMEAVLTECEQRGVKVEPICSYAVHYLARNPQWSHLLV